MLSGARKFGLYLTLAHQSLSQLSDQTRGAVLGNVWTKVIFGVSEEDAHEFARLIGLGNIDTSAIKHDAQTDTQHPLYSPLPEQWHEWATMLANQKPRQAVVRDHQGKTRMLWTIPVDTPVSSEPPFHSTLMRQPGKPLQTVEETVREGNQEALSADAWPDFDPITE